MEGVSRTRRSDAPADQSCKFEKRRRPRYPKRGIWACMAASHARQTRFTFRFQSLRDLFATRRGLANTQCHSRAHLTTTRGCDRTFRTGAECKQGVHVLGRLQSSAVATRDLESRNSRCSFRMPAKETRKRNAPSTSRPVLTIEVIDGPTKGAKFTNQVRMH